MKNVRTSLRVRAKNVTDFEKNVVLSKKRTKIT